MVNSFPNKLYCHFHYIYESCLNSSLTGHKDWSRYLCSLSDNNVLGVQLLEGPDLPSHLACSREMRLSLGQCNLGENSLCFQRCIGIFFWDWGLLSWLGHNSFSLEAEGSRFTLNSLCDECEEWSPWVYRQEVY
jgi:hypothetical protein